jgi:hypothetical protein
MTDHIKSNLQNWEERAAIHARETTGDYMLNRFRAGERPQPNLLTSLGNACCICSVNRLELARRGKGVRFVRKPSDRSIHAALDFISGRKNPSG